MYFGNYFLVLRNQVGSIVLIPFDPISPHFYDFFSIKFSRNAEPRNCVSICVEMLFLFKIPKLSSEYFDDFLLVGLNLGQLAIRDAYGVAS